MPSPPTAGAGRGRPEHSQDGHRWQQRDTTPGVAGGEGRNVCFVSSDAERVGCENAHLYRACLCFHGYLRAYTNKAKNVDF